MILQGRLAQDPGRVIAGAVTGFGGFLLCESCGSSRLLGDIAEKLNRGWPICCGYTMTWQTRHDR